VVSLAHPDAQVAAIAAQQRGNVTTGQLNAAGLGRGAIARRVRNGRLHPRHVGVYAVGHTAEIPLAPEAAALLACGEDTALSHRSGGVVWALCRPQDDLVDLTSPRRIRRPGIRGHVAVLEPRDVRVVQGLRVTAPARTLLDLAEVLPPGEVERAVAEAFARRLATEREVRSLLDARRADTGCGRSRRCSTLRAGPR
jgi:hypothetical protein